VISILADRHRFGLPGCFVVSNKASLKRE
jgi:hypothetical protein